MLHIRNILVAKDLSDSSEQALRIAYALAARTGAVLHLVHVQVLHPDPFAPTSYPSDHRGKVVDAMASVLDRIVADRGASGGPRPETRTEVLAETAVAPALVRYAAGNDIDLIVSGTHGRRGIRHMMLGSVAEELVRTAGCPVLTVRAGDGDRAVIPGPGSCVLVPVDFSDHSLQAIRVGREMAALYGCPLHLAHVVEETLHPAFYNAGAFSIYDLQPDVERRALDHLRGAYASAPGPDVETSFDIRTGHAAAEIVQLAKELPGSMIVMATHGLTGLAHLFIGSVAEHVVRASPVPVFTLKVYSDGPSGVRQSHREAESA